MPRIRQIKPEFFLDDDLAFRCCRDARLAFIGLWTLADREGRLEDRPARIKALLFPYDDDISPNRINELLDELVNGCFIIRYEVDGKRLIWIRNFRRHQHCHIGEPASQLPEPPEDIKQYGTCTMAQPCKYDANTPTSTSTSTSTSGGIASRSSTAAQGRRRPSRKTGAPSEFEISGLLKDWASRECPNLDLTGETERFLDYHRARGNSFVDWDAAWKNWMRKAVKFGAEHGAQASKDFTAGRGARGLNSRSYKPDTVGQPPEVDAQLSPEFAEALAAKANQLFGALEVDEKT